MSIYSEPPPLRPFMEDKPTLLVCWWITLFCTVMIYFRIGGRFVRSERLFKEDKVVALALIPLYLRIGCVHVILRDGTNNAQLEGANLSDEQLHRKEVASGLVLFSRILYAATLWILKGTILEFFRRLNITWRRSYYITLAIIRGVLIATFIAVIITDLAECRPFSHYWQVLPDPGGQCRQGYVQLLTMGVCNVFTDLLLVFFPIPVIVSSGMSLKRKTQLILLFSLSLAPVAVTLYRIPHILADHGSQATRSLLASVEILFATVAANALVLGSFVRDRGVKKRKFKYGSTADGGESLDRSSASESGGRRPTMNRLQWGSLEDLARDTGYGVRPELRETESTADVKRYTPAPILTMDEDIHSWDFPSQKRESGRSDDSLIDGETRPPATPRKVSFFDVGGLLGEPSGSSRRDSNTSVDPMSPHHHNIPSPVTPASGTGFRRGSTAFLQDIGGLLSPSSLMSPVSSYRGREERTRSVTEMQPISPSRARKTSHAADGRRPMNGHASADGLRQQDMELLDPGGLLD